MKKYIKKHIISYAITIAMGLAFSVVNIYISLILNQVIDIVVAKDTTAFTQIIIKAIIYFICITACYYLYLLSVKITIKLVLRDLRLDVFKGILSQDYKTYNSINTADYISSISNDMNILEETYLIPSVYGIQQLCLFLGALIVLLRLSVIITVCLVVCVLMAMLFPSLYSRILQKRQKAYSEQLSDYTKSAKDYYNGYEVIKSFNLLDIIFQRFQLVNVSLATAKMKKDNAFNVNESISFFFSFFSQLLILLVGAYLILVDNITMGMLVAIIQLSGNFVNPISNIMQAFSKVSSTKPIRTKLLTYASNTTHNEKVKNLSFLESIALNNVSFSYEDNSNFLLDSVNLFIRKGCKYAIVGGSGSGKTTLVNLITGRERDYSGEILIDGSSIQGIGDFALNQLIAINHQNIFLFEGTIKDNICLFQDYSKDKLETALIKSGVNKFLPNLNDGIDTLVGENGNKLSGGQKQRIALARAFLQQKPILILDEGTSSVDMQTGFEIENELLHDTDLTLITITHRLSPDLLSQYDAIIVLNNGAVKEIGNYKQVTKNNDLADFFKHKNV